MSALRHKQPFHKRSFGELSLGIKTPSKIWTYGVAAHFELS